MPRYSAHSLGHFADQLACADAERKTKLDRSESSGSRKTDDGVTKLKRAESPEVITVDSSSEEENCGGSFSEEDWSADGSELKSEELMDQIALVESDEILAHYLQEEINGEFHNPEGEEEELLEQQDINPNIMSFTRDGCELNQDITINCSMEPLYLNGQHFPLQVSPMQNSNLRRNEMRFSGPEMEHEMWLLSQLQKGLSSSQMDRTTISELLKELESTYENRIDVDMPDSFYPGFYNDVYEDDSAVDEIVGATDSEINNLPVSTVKGDKVEDACAICLDAPSVGAVVRHLPCMHKLHKACIDTWLRIRNCCPICKIAIN